MTNIQDWAGAQNLMSYAKLPDKNTFIHSSHRSPSKRVKLCLKSRKRPIAQKAMKVIKLYLQFIILINVCDLLDVEPEMSFFSNIRFNCSSMCCHLLDQLFCRRKKNCQWKVKFRWRKILFYYIKSIFRRQNLTFRQRNIFFAGEKKIRRADGIGIWCFWWVWLIWSVWSV